MDNQIKQQIKVVPSLMGKQINTNKTTSKINFTEDQEVAVKELLNFLNEDFNPQKYIIGVSGAAGVGKTFTIKYVVDKCNYTSSCIAFTAPTHKACRVLSLSLNNRKVNTIQSTFGFRLDLSLEDFNPDNPQFNPKAKHKLEGKYLLIIDEASMLPSKLTNYIERVCKDKSIKIIYIGDEHQLPPVNEKYSTAFLHCYKLLRLTQIVRQDSNNPASRLIQLLRDDITNNTFEFTNTINNIIRKNNGYYYDFNEIGEGYCICDRKKFEEYVRFYFNDEEYAKNTQLNKVIAYTNDVVTSWNNYIRNNIIIDAHKGILTKNDLLWSNLTIVDDFLDTIIYNGNEYIVYDINKFVDSKYNLDGYLVRLQNVFGGEVTQPLFIVNHLDYNSVIRYVQMLDGLKTKAYNSYGSKRTAVWKEYFDFKNKYLLMTTIKDKYGKTKYTPDIDYGFAITAHKAQGSTFVNCFIDLRDMIYDVNGRIRNNIDEKKHLMYTAISRISKSLFICYN